jgi:hypothetical protein
MTLTLPYKPENTTASAPETADAVHSVSSVPDTTELILIQRGWLPREQEYYWSEEWQAGERESRAELAAGHGVRFETAEDAIRWLLADDD